MSREAHVRFWESAGVKLPCATQLPLERQARRMGGEGLRVTPRRCGIRSTRSPKLLTPAYLAVRAQVLSCPWCTWTENTVEAADEETQQTWQVWCLSSEQGAYYHLGPAPQRGGG